MGNIKELKKQYLRFENLLFGFIHEICLILTIVRLS